MLEQLTAFIWHRSAIQLARDALDVVIVYYVTYRVLLLVKGTRAQHVALGLFFVFALYLAAQVLQLVTVLTILSSLIASFILIVVVVFQNDIRRGLMRMGARSWLPAQVRAQESRVIEEVVEAATELARHRIGAIIAFEQDANLDDFVGVHKGKEVDAAVSSELLVSLFVPEGMNKLHDGAVILRNLRVAKAGVFFPMPEGKALAQHFGSRHRAAVGITEETDAVVVVVSEERGTISCCFNGNIAPDLNGARLKEMLESIFNPRPRRRSKPLPVKRPAVVIPAVPESSPEPEVPSEDVVTIPMRAEAAARSSRGGQEAAESLRLDSRRTEDAVPSSRMRASEVLEEDASPQSRARSSLEVEGGPVETPMPLRARSSLDGEGAASEPPPPLRPRPSLDGELSRKDAVLPLRSRSAAEGERSASIPPPPLRSRISLDVETPHTPGASPGGPAQGTGSGPGSDVAAEAEGADESEPPVRERSAAPASLSPPNTDSTDQGSTPAVAAEGEAKG